MPDPSGAPRPAEPDYLALRGRMAPEVPTGLMAHSARVVALAERFARRHGADLAVTLRAAQGHDLLRAVADAELLRMAEARGIEILPVERDQPVLLHGPLGALELAERFRLHDPRVLDAVRYHTTGHPEYGLEAWAMFVADKVEPKKLEAWPALGRLLDLADRSLEEAALAYLELSAERARAEGWAVHPLADRTRAALAARVGSG
jgi:predicted HD superfamily hydrolase involved in NAD metabolism